VIQEIRITNSESRLDRTRSLVTCAINESFHPRLYQSACTHHTRLNCRINHRFVDPVVTQLPGGRSQRHDFRVCRWILIGARSVSRNREYCSISNDAGADGNLAALSRLLCRSESLAHPVCVRFSFPSSSHDRNIRVKQRKIEL
jgi:hypothetical protein